jgi:hypothetical protein
MCGSDDISAPGRRDPDPEATFRRRVPTAASGTGAGRRRPVAEASGLEPAGGPPLPGALMLPRETLRGAAAPREPTRRPMRQARA